MFELRLEQDSRRTERKIREREQRDIERDRAAVSKRGEQRKRESCEELRERGKVRCVAWL